MANNDASLMNLLGEGVIPLPAATTIPGYTPLVDPTVTAAQDILARPYQTPTLPGLLGTGVIGEDTHYVHNGLVYPDFRDYYEDAPAPVAQFVTDGDSSDDLFTSEGSTLGSSPETTPGSGVFDAGTVGLGQGMDLDRMDRITALENPSLLSYMFFPGMTLAGKYALAPMLTEQEFAAQSAAFDALDAAEGLPGGVEVRSDAQGNVYTISTPKSIAAYDAAVFDDEQEAVDEVSMPSDYWTTYSKIQDIDEQLADIEGTTSRADEIAAWGEAYNIDPVGQTFYTDDPWGKGDDYWGEDTSTAPAPAAIEDMTFEEAFGPGTPGTTASPESTNVNNAGSSGDGGYDSGDSWGDSQMSAEGGSYGTDEGGGLADSGDSGGDDGCFIASTAVTLDNCGTKPISAIKVGDHVLSACGRKSNKVTYIEKVDWGHKYTLYSPVKDIEPFATNNHPIIVDGEWKTIDLDYTERNHPWLKASKLQDAYTAGGEDIVVYNLWVDGDGTYQVNGYGTSSLIGDGGVVRHGLEQGIIDISQFVDIANGAKDAGMVINYGMHIGNLLMARFSDRKDYTKWILDSVMGNRKGYTIKALIYLFGVSAVVSQPRLWKLALKRYIIDKTRYKEVNHGTA